MIHHELNLQGRLRVVLYLRMSSDEQNVRSPDQQRETIESTIKRLRLPWTIVAIYIDSGISGRLTRQRLEYQRMLADIRTGRVTVDAILVDTFERFGRTDEGAHLCNELRKRHGVVVLTADKNFADPTTPSGRAMTMFETMRATEDGRIKAHNVVRGKRDVVLLKHWPGGSAPFGFRLKSVLTNRNGRDEVDYTVIEHEPETACIVRRTFQLADDRGYGSTRITRELNADPAISDRFKPFSDQTIWHRLRDEIYKGTLVWPKVRTDIVDSRRVTERTPAAEQLVIPGYCEAIIAPEQWERVNKQIRKRGERVRAARLAAREAGPQKAIAPIINGVAIKYLLSGLVRCGHCGRAMVAGSSSPYTKASGEVRRYVHYHCPGKTSGVCTNHRYVQEEWLRSVVVGLIRTRLLTRLDKPSN